MLGPLLPAVVDLDVLHPLLLSFSHAAHTTHSFPTYVHTLLFQKLKEQSRTLLNTNVLPI